jgi:hypothetical protein
MLAELQLLVEPRVSVGLGRLVKEEVGLQAATCPRVEVVPEEASVPAPPAQPGGVRAILDQLFMQGRGRGAESRGAELAFVVAELRP